MNVFTNKHMIVALLVAPVLAVGAYFAVGYFWGERPQAAKEGASYRLVEKPNCRYDSGRCGLANAEFELALTLEDAPGGAATLLLEAAFPLDGVVLAVDRAGQEAAEPIAMRAAAPDLTRWAMEIARPRPGEDRLRLVAAAGGAYYFGEASTEFTRR